MTLYLCRWPNGHLSLVTAWDEEEAILRLDAFGNAERAELRPIDDLRVDLRLTDAGELQVDQWGAGSQEDVMEWAYPLLSEALYQRDEGGGDPTEVVALGEVVERERERAVAGSDAGASGPRSTRGKEVQGVTDAPAALIRALEEQVATQRLKETEIEGPEN